MTIPESAAYQYYLLDDGRVWNIPAGRFVSGLPEGADFKRPVGENGKANEDSLRECLLFFGYPLGDLKADEDFAAEARGKRDGLLAETDFMMMPDYPLSEAKRAAVAAYRQALRDVPGQAGFPRQIDWPVKP